MTWKFGLDGGYIGPIGRVPGSFSGSFSQFRSRTVSGLLANLFGGHFRIL